MARDIRVTVRASNKKLTSMFTEHFSSVKAAKHAMEMDAKAWCELHDGQMMWRAPDAEDFLIAKSKRDKIYCIWQYFDI